MQEVNKFKQEIANMIGVSVDEMLSKSRKANLVKARQLFVCGIREYTDYSLTKTGKELNRDHATVYHLINISKIFIETEKEFKELHKKAMLIAYQIFLSNDDDYII